WNPGASSTVRTLAVHNNVLYAGGGFNQVGGQTRKHLAAFTVANEVRSAACRALLEWDPGANNWVETHAGHHNELYAGGCFAQAHSQTRNRLGAHTVANGETPADAATLLDWNPGANSSVETLAVHNNVLYAGGYFTQAGGQTRERLAAFTVAN